MSDKNIWTGEDRRNYETRHEELVKAVVCAVRDEVSVFSVSEEVHRDHHAFITEWLQEQQRKRLRAEKIKTQVGGWAIISLLSGIGTGAYQAAMYLKEHLK